MTERRFNLDEQIHAVSAVAAGVRAGAEPGEDRIIDYHADALAAAVATLRFMRTHEQTIRDAIRAARELDAAAPRE